MTIQPHDSLVGWTHTICIAATFYESSPLLCLLVLLQNYPPLSTMEDFERGDARISLDHL